MMGVLLQVLIQISVLRKNARKVHHKKMNTMFFLKYGSMSSKFSQSKVLKEEIYLKDNR